MTAWLVRIAWIAAVLSWPASTLSAAEPLRVLSLNACYDDWLPQLLETKDTVIPSANHGNRLESIIRAQPDVIVHNNFISAVLLRALQRSATDFGFRLVAVKHPQSWQEWQEQGDAVGLALQRETTVQRWFALQQEQLTQAGKRLPRSVTILMPNYYMWAADSWVADLLAQVNVELVTPIQTGQLGQVGLASLLRLNTEHLVLEGFSEHYARGQDWMHHRALRQWSSERQTSSIAGDIAGCPATRAIHYLEAMQSD
ncbi:hypothetical protein CWE22_11780 [Pseudidiomarina aestuarii]|uniref:Fe/B12 periplasmic-binding domain-containing protein n=1 Tax=Pseudidiomarina aestuarii TaxID=624146 RepID=A0A7Z7ESQ9_9GAMM|nr:ABC transporter substrate-binding protein [Pseudidiomarina aestuarii]RUO37909.1 hypothetical protein CWE22_11780 [Pseudidiomarina aestuarii]